MAQLKIYATTLSGYGRKVLALCKHLNITFELLETNVYKGEGQTPEFLAINPEGKIPTLVDNNFVLTESNAILQYIAELHASELLGESPQERACISQWLFWESCQWHPALSNVIEGVVGHQLAPEYIPMPDTPPNWHDEKLEKCLSYLNNTLKKSAYVAGDKLTIADFSMAGMMTYARFSGFPFAHYPNIHKWYSKIEQLDAWSSTRSEFWESL